MSSVIGSSVRVVFCEGKTDVQFLYKYFKEVDLAVVEGLGKYAISSFLKGYLKGRDGAPNCLAIRDRDFDFKPEPPVKLIPTGKDYLFTTHRASIESYWFDPTLIRRYLEWLGQMPNYRARNLPLPDLAHIGQIIADAAQSISAYQAARWALAEMRTLAGRFELSEKWVKESGQLPQDLSPEGSLLNGKSYLADFRNKALSASVETDFESHFQAFQRHFNSSDFVANQEYLTWFHGKDLVTAFHRVIANDPKFRLWNFSFEKYYQAYCDLTNTALIFDLAPHPDLLELKRRINQLN